MPNVIHEFCRWAHTLLLTANLGAQAVAPSIQGGGEVRIEGKTLRFVPRESAATAPRGSGTPSLRILRIRGELGVPGQRPLELELQVDVTGRIYRLQLFRAKKRRGEEVRWGATLQTRVVIQVLEPRLGGTVRLGLSGPLVGVVEGQARQSTWQGALWVTLQSWPEG